LKVCKEELWSHKTSMREIVWDTAETWKKKKRER